MGQGCSSGLGAIVENSAMRSKKNERKFAESPDLVMHEIVQGSLAAIQRLRKNARAERFGEDFGTTTYHHNHYYCHDTILDRLSLDSRADGQEHLLFHNLEKKQQQLQQQLQRNSSHHHNSSSSSMPEHHNKASHKQRRGRRIAESFEAERDSTVEAGVLAKQQQTNHSHTSSLQKKGSDRADCSLLSRHEISEAVLEDFELSLVDKISKAYPTRLWIRRRSFPTTKQQRKHKPLKRNPKPPLLQKDEQQNRLSPCDDDDDDDKSAAVPSLPPPQVVLLEEGKSYRRKNDYFGLSQSPNNNNSSNNNGNSNKNSNKNSNNNSNKNSNGAQTAAPFSTHIYAVRYSEDGGGNHANPATTTVVSNRDEQRAASRKPAAAATATAKQHTTESPPLWIPVTDDEASVASMFSQANMALPPQRDVVSWTTVSEEHDIYVVDLGLTPKHCDELVTTTEQECKGRYAAYTYAKQTLGCKEYPLLARAALGPVHSMVGAIMDKFDGLGPDDAKEKAKAKQARGKARGQTDENQTRTTNDSTITDPIENKDKRKTKDLSCGKNVPFDENENEKEEEERQTAAASPPPPRSPKPRILQLDDREPHIVKYDVTKKERQKLDMHTDKSEWTFLIALSDGCGLDYEGGGTYFECLDATVHIQKGHALVFPGKLRHKGQAIHHGLRFLLVGFLVDKGETATPKPPKPSPSSKGESLSSAAAVATATATATPPKQQPSDDGQALLLSQNDKGKEDNPRSSSVAPRYQVAAA